VAYFALEYAANVLSPRINNSTDEHLTLADEREARILRFGGHRGAASRVTPVGAATRASQMTPRNPTFHLHDNLLYTSDRSILLRLSPRD
jgi:hypothetical protein